MSQPDPCPDIDEKKVVQNSDSIEKESILSSQGSYKQLTDVQCQNQAQKASQQVEDSHEKVKQKKNILDDTDLKDLSLKNSINHDQNKKKNEEQEKEINDKESVNEKQLSQFDSAQLQYIDKLPSLSEQMSYIPVITQSLDNLSLHKQDNSFSSFNNSKPRKMFHYDYQSLPPDNNHNNLFVDLDDDQKDVTIRSTNSHKRRKKRMGISETVQIDSKQESIQQVRQQAPKPVINLDKDTEQVMIIINEKDKPYEKDNIEQVIFNTLSKKAILKSSSQGTEKELNRSQIANLYSELLKPTEQAEAQQKKKKQQEQQAEFDRLFQISRIQRQKQEKKQKQEKQREKLIQKALQIQNKEIQQGEVVLVEKKIGKIITNKTLIYQQQQKYKQSQAQVCQQLALISYTDLIFYEQTKYALRHLIKASFKHGIMHFIEQHIKKQQEEDLNVQMLSFIESGWIWDNTVPFMAECLFKDPVRVKNLPVRDNDTDVTLSNSLSGKHTIFGKIEEGLDIVRKINDTYVDQNNQPQMNIRIMHTFVLDDPFEDSIKMKIRERSPSPIKNSQRLEAIQHLEMLQKCKTQHQIIEATKRQKAKKQAVTLEMLGQLPDANLKPPQNILFVCKLNPITQQKDLQIIFSRFGPIKSVEIVRDWKTGQSLQYSFIEFDNITSCEEAYLKMNNVVIDDRRIQVDFSQSVSKLMKKKVVKPVKRYQESHKSNRELVARGFTEGKDKRQKYDLVVGKNQHNYGPTRYLEIQREEQARHQMQQQIAQKRSKSRQKRKHKDRQRSRDQKHKKKKHKRSESHKQKSHKKKHKKREGRSYS